MAVFQLLLLTIGLAFHCTYGNLTVTRLFK